MKDYEINENTLAVIAKDNSNSYVYETNDDKGYVINSSVNKIMEDSCMYFGSSFEGRKESSAVLLNSHYKVPVVVEETNEIIFFPTSSPRLKDCSWISLNHISSYKKDKNGCEITFNDGKTLIIPVSFAVLDKQILRSYKLKTCLIERKRGKNTKNGSKLSKKVKK